MMICHHVKKRHKGLCLSCLFELFADEWGDSLLWRLIFLGYSFTLFDYRCVFASSCFPFNKCDHFDDFVTEFGQLIILRWHDISEASPLLIFPWNRWKPGFLSFAQIISKVATIGFLFPLSSEKENYWILNCYDCGRLFINFPFFELLGKFYCFIMKRKNASISLNFWNRTHRHISQQSVWWFIRGCFESTNVPSCFWWAFRRR